MIYSYLLIITTLLVLMRLMLSKNFAEALLSLDVLGNLLILYFVLLAIYSSQHFWIDVALVFAMFSFVGVMAISKYMVDENG